ncbi:MAG: hypothetical protein HYT94_03335 [Parcubacteria group bacterium]|nr:hypothetical protein [Parcubacteria group bacterium]
MQSPFPTKKFFLVLAFLVLLTAGIFEAYQLSNKNAVNDAAIAVENKNVALKPYGNTIVATTDAQGEPVLATSTMRAVATVAYLREQTKANGATLEQIAGGAGQKIQAEKKKLDADTYTAKDVKTSDDNSPEALKRYGNIMAGIFLFHGQKQQSSSYIEIIKEALEKNNPKKLEELDPFIDFYKNVLTESLSFPVPSSALSVHLKIINSYAETFILLDGFRNLFGDIFPAVASQSRLDESSKRFIEAFAAASTFFKQKEVEFLPREGGNLFAFVAK